MSDKQFQVKKKIILLWIYYLTFEFNSPVAEIFAGAIPELLVLILKAIYFWVKLWEIFKILHDRWILTQVNRSNFHVRGSLM